MNYTQADFDRIKTAIDEYIDGDRVGEVRTASTTLKYAEVSLSDLYAERDRIQKALRPKRRRYQPLYMSKGL